MILEWDIACLQRPHSLGISRVPDLSPLKITCKICKGFPRNLSLQTSWGEVFIASESENSLILGHIDNGRSHSRWLTQFEKSIIAILFSDVDYYESLLCLEALQMCTSVVLYTSVTRVSSQNPEHLIGRLGMRQMLHDGNTFIKLESGPLEYVRITFLPPINNYKRVIQIFGRQATNLSIIFSR